MVRAPEAPVETAKFMGHGFCDNVTKSVTLATYTSELSVISKTVFNIKSILNVPAHELRGIGIQISKLNTATVSSNDANRKNRLKSMFENVQAKQNMKTSKTTLLLYDAEETITDNVHHRGKTSSFRKVKSFNGTSSPNLSGKPNLPNKKSNKLYESLDLSVLAELPHDIRDEVLRDQDRMLNIELKNPNYPNLVPLKKSFARKLENEFPEVGLTPPSRISSKLVSI